MPMQGGNTGDKSSGAVRMGRAFVELTGDDTKLAKALSAAKKKVLDFGVTLTKAGVAGLAAGAAILAPLTRLFVGGVNRAAGIQNMADKLHVPIEQLSRLQHAADVAGVALDEVLDDPRRFRDLIAAAPILDSATGRQAVEVQRAFNGAIIDLKNALLPLLSVITPVVKTVAQFVRANASALAIVAGVGAALATAGAVVAGFGLTLSAVAAVSGAVVAAFGALVKLLLTPAGLLTAGIVAVGSQLFDLKTGFLELLDTAKGTIRGIVDALSAGDLALAARVGLAGISLEWTKAVMFWTEKWVAFKNLIVDGWHSVGDVVEEAIAGWAAGWIWLTRGHAEAKQFLDDLDRNLAEMRQHRDRDNQAFRNNQLGDAQKAVDAAKAALDGVLGQAAEAADKARFNEEMRRRGLDLDMSGRLGAVKGSFATPQALLQFGIGEQVSMQAKIFGALKENLPVIAKEITILNQRFKLQ